MKFFFPLLLCLISAVSLAIEPNLKLDEKFENHVFRDEATMNTYIKQLSDEPYKKPVDILQKLERIAKLAKDEQWISAQVQSKIVMMNILTSMEDFTTIEQLFTETTLLADSIVPDEDNYELYQEMRVRLDIIELNLVTGKGQDSLIPDTQAKLKTSLSSIVDPLLKADVLQQLGRSHSVLEDYVNSIDNLKSAYQLYVQQGDAPGSASSLVALGNLYNGINKSEMSIQYYEKALVFIREQGDQFGESIILYNLAKGFEQLDKCDTAISYAKSSINASKAINDEIGVAWANIIIADCFARQGKWESALLLYQENEPIFESTNATRIQMGTLNGIAEAAIELGNISLAEQSLQKSKNLKVGFQTLEQEYEHLKLQSKLFYQKQDFKAAYDDLAASNELLLKIKDQENQSELERFRIEFDTELKEAENALLTEKNDLNQQLITQQKQKSNWFLLMLLMVIIILLLVIVFTLKQMSLRKEFKLMSLEDPLTKVRNRRSIIERATQMLDKSRFTGKELTLILIDIDHFKRVNDNYGHETGDKVLVCFAEACKRSFRNSDAFGRYGGEEWLAVLQDCDGQRIDNIFNRISDELKHSKIQGLPDFHQITFSMGVVSCHATPDTTLSSLISSADERLYKAKELGRNQYVDSDFVSERAS